MLLLLRLWNALQRQCAQIYGLGQHRNTGSPALTKPAPSSTLQLGIKPECGIRFLSYVEALENPIFELLKIVKRGIDKTRNPCVRMKHRPLVKIEEGRYPSVSPRSVEK